MIEFIKPLDLAGDQRGLVLTLRHIDKRGLEDAQILAVMEAVLNGYLRDKGKDPAFWSILKETEHQPAIRTTTYAVLGSPEAEND